MPIPPSKRRHLRLALAFISFLLAISLFLFLFARSNGPHHAGQSLDAWLSQYTGQSLNWPRTDQPPDDAIRALGTNCFPAIIERLQARDSAAKLRLIQTLRTLRINAPIPTRHTAHTEALAALGALGHTALPLVPHLADALDHMDVPHRISAGFWLEKIGPDAEAAIPALLRVLQNQTNLFPRHLAVQTLSAIGERQRDLILPILRQCLTDSNSAVRLQARNELTRDHWVNTPKPPPDYAATNLLQLQSGAPPQQTAAAYYFAANPVAAPQVIPLLISNLTSTNTQLLEISAKALAAYRQHASPALPHLTNLLTHPKKYIRRAASNALQTIHPSQPPQSP